MPLEQSCHINVTFPFFSSELPLLSLRFYAALHIDAFKCVTSLSCCSFSKQTGICTENCRCTGNSLQLKLYCAVRTKVLTTRQAVQQWIYAPVHQMAGQDANSTGDWYIIPSWNTLLLTNTQNNALNTVCGTLNYVDWLIGWLIHGECLAIFE